MPIHAWLPAASGGAFLPALVSLLGPEVRLTSGPLAEDAAPVDVLVGGTPTPAELDRCLALGALSALVIPYAGVPKHTRALLLQRTPSLAVHNLHHNAASTAELALTLMLAAAKRVVPYDQALRQGDWRPRYAPSETLLLEGLTALVLGYGAIGRRVARGCLGLGMHVRATRRSGAADPGAPDVQLGPPGSLGGWLVDTDVLLVCLPATPDTVGLIDAAVLAALPDHALVVNVGRGSLIDEQALHAALVAGTLGGAGLDVWYRYPRTEAERTSTLPATAPLHELENVVLSPHRGGHATCTEQRRAEGLAHLLTQCARGEAMDNPVNLGAGY